VIECIYYYALPLPAGPDTSEAAPIPAVNRAMLLALVLLLGACVAWVVRRKS